MIERMHFVFASGSLTGTPFPKHLAYNSQHVKKKTHTEKVSKKTKVKSNQQTGFMPRISQADYVCWFNFTMSS